jgi:hypothetical protein
MVALHFFFVRFLDFRFGSQSRNSENLVGSSVLHDTAELERLFLRRFIRGCRGFFAAFEFEVAIRLADFKSAFGFARFRATSQKRMNAALIPT